MHVLGFVEALNDNTPLFSAVRQMQAYTQTLISKEVYKKKKCKFFLRHQCLKPELGEKAEKLHFQKAAD